MSKIFKDQYMPVSDTILDEIDQMPLPSLEGRKRVDGILIDDDYTLRHEDAIWIREQGNTAIIDISIIDLSAVLPLQSQMMQRAFRLIEDRWITKVLQDDKLHGLRILPNEFFHKFFPHKRHILWPAITVSLTVDKVQSKIIDAVIQRSALQPLTKYTHKEFWRFTEDPASRFFRWHEVIESLFNKVDADSDDKTPHLPALYNIQKRRPGIKNERKRKTHPLVDTCMHLANEIIAVKMQENNVPFIFCTHSLVIYKEGAKRVFNSTPFSHPKYGSTPYCIFSTPAQNLVNLINQYQVSAYLSEQPLPYSKEQIDLIIEDINWSTKNKTQDPVTIATKDIWSVIDEQGPTSISKFIYPALTLLIEDIISRNIDRPEIIKAIEDRINDNTILNADVARILFAPAANENFRHLQLASINRMNRVPQSIPAVLEAIEANHAHLYIDEFILPGEEGERYIVRHRMQTENGWLCGSTIPLPTDNVHWAINRGAVAFLDDRIHGRLIRPGIDVAQTRFETPLAEATLKSAGIVGQLITQLFQQGATMTTATTPPRYGSDNYESDLTITLAGTGDFLLYGHGKGDDAINALENAIANLREPQPG